MTHQGRWCRRLATAALALAAIVAGASSASADGLLGIYGARMVPDDRDAERFSRPGWGGGVQVVVPVSATHELLAGVLGFEMVNLLDEDTPYFDPLTGLRVEQQTSQNTFRCTLGPRLGLHGGEVLRPHMGLNLGVNVYNISTDVVVPDDYDRQNEIRQNLRSETNAAFGYDGTLGVELNLRNQATVDFGVRFVKTFGVPQQLGEGSVRISPSYFQYYLGLGLSFGFLRAHGRD